MVAAPDGDGAIGVAFDGSLDRHKGGGPVMLRPVELHASRDPWAGKPNQSGLDHILAVKEVVAVQLVEADMDPAANFRQDHDSDVFVFEMDRPPAMVLWLRADAIDDGERVDTAAASLVDAPL